MAARLGNQKDDATRGSSYLNFKTIQKVTHLNPGEYICWRFSSVTFKNQFRDVNRTVLYLTPLDEHGQPTTDVETPTHGAFIEREIEALGGRDRLQNLPPPLLCRLGPIVPPSLLFPRFWNRRQKDRFATLAVVRPPNSNDDAPARGVQEEDTGCLPGRSAATRRKLEAIRQESQEAEIWRASALERLMAGLGVASPCDIRTSDLEGLKWERFKPLTKAYHLKPGKYTFSRYSTTNFKNAKDNIRTVLYLIPIDDQGKMTSSIETPTHGFYIEQAIEAIGGRDKLQDSNAPSVCRLRERMNTPKKTRMAELLRVNVTEMFAPEE